ncbi:MAG: class I SAM-dependent methyltransferase [Candidatus Diapherotrites archaeon]|nr:class I SAM-dependent methyltransferase [Candidatus Diapherotrites archaeon]
MTDDLNTSNKNTEEITVTQRSMLDYNQYHGENLRHEIQDLITSLVQKGNLKKGDTFRMLDIGAGRGNALLDLRYSAKQIADRHGINVEAVGLNHEEQGHSYEVVGDAQKMTFPDNFFHYIVSTETSQYVPDKLAMLKETHRVLHPDGIARIHLFINEIEGPENIEEELEQQGVKIVKTLEDEKIKQQFNFDKEPLKDFFRILIFNKHDTPTLNLPYEFKGHKKDPLPTIEGHRISVYKPK